MLQPYLHASLLEAGCDEVGRGCLAGPVVAAAVILPQDFTHPLLNDSKQVTSANRALLVPIIKEKALAWAIGEATVQEVDAHNILQASYIAMHRAIAQLKVTPELLLVDGHRFKAYEGIPHECIVKGDSQLTAIAAASILAKTYRDARMQNLALDFPTYGWERNMGYPTQQHRQAIQANGITPHHRKSFKLQPKA